VFDPANDLVLSGIGDMNGRNISTSFNLATRKHEALDLDLDLAANFSLVVDWLDWDVCCGNGTTTCYTCLQAFTRSNHVQAQGQCPSLFREASRMSRPAHL
jgi:hypothetical protein